ncbi:hypothetical protein HAX54_039226 [Datura stramonium]|uniref:Uncharacterized protein n=1 Tax=Datura stramonium TaxID=4076 RepID=A0ABS8VNR9_DATST|nr:hypothetical protein [Datura stramonium]
MATGLSNMESIMLKLQKSSRPVCNIGALENNNNNNNNSVLNAKQDGRPFTRRQPRSLGVHSGSHAGPYGDIDPIRAHEVGPGGEQPRWTYMNKVPFSDQKVDLELLGLDKYKPSLICFEKQESSKDYNLQR